MAATWTLTEHNFSVIFENQHCRAWKVKPECNFCHVPFRNGERIREMGDYPPKFLHFECWKRKVAQEKQASKELQEKRRKERQERREKLRLQNKDPPNSFRLSTHFLRMFGQKHGFLMGCAVCRHLFHPGSLVTTENVNGARKVIHYNCRMPKKSNLEN